MEKAITYAGLDVHKDTIAVALAEAGMRSDVREYGKIANTPAALNMLAAKLAHGGRSLRFCYEAGPCGYGIQRQLRAAGHGCAVVAPSLIPRKPGERIKTDRRDAMPAQWALSSSSQNATVSARMTVAHRRSPYNSGGAAAPAPSVRTSQGMPPAASPKAVSPARRRHVIPWPPSPRTASPSSTDRPPGRTSPHRHSRVPARPPATSFRARWRSARSSMPCRNR